MACVKVIGNNLSEEDLQKLKALALAAGCPESDLEVVESVGEPDPDCPDEIILVLLVAPTCADAGLEKDLAKAQNGGRRVICVWPQNGDSVELPPGAQKYSYSVIPWDIQKLKVAIADDDVTCFESSDGKPLPAVEVERNLCVDEPGKPK